MNLDVLDFVARGKFIYMLTNPHVLLLTLEEAGELSWRLCLLCSRPPISTGLSFLKNRRCISEMEHLLLGKIA